MSRERRRTPIFWPSLVSDQPSQPNSFLTSSRRFTLPSRASLPSSLLTSPLHSCCHTITARIASFPHVSFAPKCLQLRKAAVAEQGTLSARQVPMPALQSTGQPLPPLSAEQARPGGAKQGAEARTLGRPAHRTPAGALLGHPNRRAVWVPASTRSH